jgi:hypothetical protein
MSWWLRVLIVLVVILIAGISFASLTKVTMGSGEGPLTIVVQVVDETGEPLPGATVSLLVPDDAEDAGGWSAAQTAAADSYGVATITERFQIAFRGSTVFGDTRTFVTAWHAIRCECDGFAPIDCRPLTAEPPRFKEVAGPPYVLPVLIRMEPLAPEGE